MPKAKELKERAKRTLKFFGSKEAASALKSDLRQIKGDVLKGTRAVGRVAKKGLKALRKGTRKATNRIKKRK